MLLTNKNISDLQWTALASNSELKSQFSSDFLGKIPIEVAAESWQWLQNWIKKRSGFEKSFWEKDLSFLLKHEKSLLHKT